MIIRVLVVPNSSQDKLEKIAENEFKVHLSSPAEKGKANLSLIKIISKELNVPQKSIIIKNPSSRKKIIEITPQ